MSGMGSSRSQKRLSRNELKSKLDILQKQQLEGTQDDSKNPNLPFASVLSKRDNRSSLPVFAGSSAHTGVMSVNSGEDVNFVVGLSENLLVECRRLQSENERKSSKLKNLQSDYEKLQSSFEKLTSKYETITKSEDSLKDTNWQLEIKLQSLSQEFQKLTDSFNKNKIELDKQIELSREIKTELEETSLEKMGLKNELDSRIHTHLAEINELKKHVEELNNENDKLHNNVGVLTQKVEELVKEIEEGKLLLNEKILSDRKGATSTNIVGPDSAEQAEFMSTPSKLTKRSADPVLETQTLRANLTHANQMIVKLKQQLNRFKSDTNTSSPIGKRIPKHENETGLKFTSATSTPQKSIGSELDTGFSSNLDSLTRKDSSLKLEDTSDVDMQSFVSDTMDLVRNPLSESIFDNDVNEFIHELSYDDVEVYAKSHNLMLVDATEFQKLQSENKEVSAPSKSNLEEDLPKEYNPTLSNARKVESEEKPSTEELIATLGELGYAVTEISVYDTLKRKLKLYEQPTEEYLVSKLKSYSKTVVDKAEYEKLLHPSPESLKSSLESHDYVLLSKKDHENLLHALENPPFSYLENKLQKLNKKILSVPEYETAINPNLNILREKSKDNGFELIETKDLEELKSRIDSPSREYLAEKAVNHNFVLLPKQEYSRLISPSIDDIRDKAENLDYALLHTSEYNELLEPSLTKLSELASNYNQDVIPNADLQRIENLIENPDISFLREKAKVLNHLVVPKEEFNAMNEKCNHPSLESIKESMTDDEISELVNWITEKQSFTLVNTEEFTELKHELELPSVEQIKKKAALHKCAILPDEELSALLDLAHRPGIEHLEKKLDQLGFIPVPKGEYSELLNKLEHPSIDSLSKKASSRGYTLLLKTDHTELLRKSLDPTIEEMQHVASLTGHTVVLQEDYDHMEKTINKPSKSFIIEKAEELDMIALDKNDYQALIDKGSKKESLITSVKNLGYIAIPIPELTSLKNSTVENATIGAIELRLKSLGFVTIKADQLKELSTPIIDKATIDDTIELCKKYDLKAISVSEFEKMKESSKPIVYSEDEIIEMVKSRGHVVLASENYNKMIEQLECPELEYLSKKLQVFQKIPIDESELAKLRHSIDSPTKIYLFEKARDQKLHVIPQNEYEDLKEITESPPKSFLEEKASKHGLSIISTEELEELKKISVSPSIAHLSNKASLLGKRMVDQVEYDSLSKKIEEPTLQEVENYASKLDCKILPSAEYAELTKISNDPPLDFLKSKADILHKILVDKQDWETKKHELENPSKEYLTEKASKLEYIVLAQDEYNHLKTCTESKDIGLLQKKAESVNHVLVPKETYVSLSDPSLNDLKTSSQKHGHVLLDADSYKLLTESSVESISKKEVIDLCSRFDLVPIPDEKYKQLTILSVDKIKELAETQGLIAIKPDSLESLKAKAETPELETIIEVAPKYGYKLIKNHDYDHLLTESNKVSSYSKLDVEKMASKLGLIAITEETYHTMVTNLKTASGSVSASPRSKVLASKQYFENVIKQESSNPEIILESGKSLGFVRLSNDEYKKLLDNQMRQDLSKSDIYNGAKEFDLTVLPSEEYKNLLKKKNSCDSLSYDDLEQYASRYDLKLVPMNFSDEGINAHRPIERLLMPGLNLAHSGNHSTVSLASVDTTDTVYYDANQSNNSFSLHNSPSKSSMHTSSTQFTDANDFIEQDDASIASTIKDDELSLNDLEKHAEVLGYKLIRITEGTEEVAYPEQNDHSDGLTKDAIYSAAPRFGLSVLPNEEFIEMEKIFMSESLSSENIQKVAEQLDLIVLNKDEYDSFKRNKKADSKQNTVEENSDPNTVLLDKKEYDYLKKQAEYGSNFTPTPVPIITKESIKQKAREHGYVPVATNDYLKLIKPDSIDDIKEKATKLGIVAISQKELNDLKQPITKEIIENSAYDFGLVAVPSSEYASLTKPLTKTDLKKRCENLNLVVIEKDEYDDLRNPIDANAVQSWAANTDNVIITKEEYSQLLDAEEQAADRLMTKDELIEKAHDFNLIPIEADKFDAIQHELASSGRNSLTEEDIILKAKEFGFVPVPIALYDQSDYTAMNNDSFVAKARELNLVPIPVEQFEQIKKELEKPTLTREQIVEHATEFDLIALDLKEYKRLKKGSYLIEHEDSDEDEDSDDNEDNIQDSEIKQLNKAAKRFGLLCIPETAFVATSNTNSPDVHNVVVLPIKYYNSLLNQESENWAKITDESLQTEAKRRGFQVGVNLRKDVSDAPAFSHKRHSSWGTRSIISEDARRSLSEAANSAAISEMEQQTRSRGPSRSSSIKRPSPSVQTNQGSVMTHSMSVATGLSLATMASLSEPSIIPALTQTMIGEYLHKYYRRLSPFTQSSRHERYFWIHPYTLTLYWSTSNPVLENPGLNKTRAAAIMGVESVDDPNPYPVGLYHKSIIVKTESRDIKITCPTRQRHNIWFNSLRYLIQRNMEGIDLSDMIKEGEESTASNAIYQLPGESSQSATRRLSTTRRSSLSSSVKRSNSKWSLRGN